MRDALFDGEGLRRGAGPPAGELRVGQVDAGEDEGDGPGGGVAAFGEVGFFGFGCWGVRVSNVLPGWGSVEETIAAHKRGGDRYCVIACN